jgi:CYTH domain-containing protein
MNIEIERKFLVDKSVWAKQEKPPGIFIRQGYLMIEPAKTIRVRIKGGQGFLTIKGATTGVSREEFEYEIPIEDAHELLNHYTIASLSKVRYQIPIGNKMWEVDEFSDNHAGLIVAEIEIKDEHEQFELPQWIAEEVTGDKKYYNSYLCSNPIKNHS